MLQPPRSSRHMRLSGETLASAQRASCLHSTPWSQVAKLLSYLGLDACLASAKFTIWPLRYMVGLQFELSLFIGEHYECALLLRPPLCLSDVKSSPRASITRYRLLRPNTRGWA